MNYKNLHIIIYLSYNCNLRCSYCVITFNNIQIENIVLDNILYFIDKTREKFETIFIEFIGGEPLLEINKINYFFSKNTNCNLKFQITTNGTLINSNNYNSIIKKIDIVNLSYNENYFNNSNSFIKISDIILNKNNININFIYDPKKDLSEIKTNFLFILKNGYKNINILPIVLVHFYTKNDFMELLDFINFVFKFKSYINIEFIYYIQEKNSHFEFSISPNGDVLGDNMGTAEDFFSIKNKKNNSIGNIGELSFLDIYNKLENYTYIDYLKNITKSKKVKQSYNNLLLLSNLLKKYNNEIGR